MSGPITYAALCCAVGVALEGVCAGADIRKRLAELRKPPFAPPLGVWIVIGVFYYAVCFVVLYRLFSVTSDAPFRFTAILLILLLMVINAAWNWFFFRTRNLLHALLLGVSYTVLASAVTILLFSTDRVAAICLSATLLISFTRTSGIMRSGS